MCLESSGALIPDLFFGGSGKDTTSLHDLNQLYLVPPRPDDTSCFRLTTYRSQTNSFQVFRFLSQYNKTVGGLPAHGIDSLVKEFNEIKKRSAEMSSTTRHVHDGNRVSCFS